MKEFELKEKRYKIATLRMSNYSYSKRAKWIGWYHFFLIVGLFKEKAGDFN